MSDLIHTPSEFILYQTEDGRTRIQCRFENETIWLSQIQLAELFQTTKQNIAKHLKAIFAEGEMQQESVVNHWLTTAADGKDYRVRYYNLSAILAVGYRVRSHRGTQFRKWATERLGDFLKLSDHELLDHAGKITAEQAKAKAELEYSRYRALIDAQPRPVDADFNKLISHLPSPVKRKKGGGK